MNNYDFFEDENTPKNPDTKQDSAVKGHDIEHQEKPNHSLFNKLLNDIKFEKIYLGYAAAVIILLIGGYIVLSSLFSSDTKITNTAVKHMLAQEVHFDAIPETPHQSYPKTKINDDINQMIVQLNNNTKIQEKRFESFQKNMMSLSKRIQSIDETQYRLNKEIKNIVIHIDELIKNNKDKALIQLMNTLHNQLQSMNARRLNLADNLKLTAIVDDIAWLEDKNGQSITVKTGNYLNQYGKVLKIDHEHNKVYTSSGLVFN